MLSVIGTRLLDFSGNWIGSVWIGRDITAQKRFEEALKGREQRFRVVFERVKDAIFIESAEGEILEANHTASALLGYSREELLSMRVRDLVPREEAARPPARSRTETACRETEMLRKDGRRIFVDARRSPAEVGGLKCVIAIVRDISERKRIEEETRSAARRFERLAELTSEWVWETDAARRLTYSNVVSKRLVGYAPEEFLGTMHIHDLLSPGDAEARNAFAAGKRLQESRMVFVRKDRRETVLSINAFPILDESGNFEGYRGSGVELSAIERERDELRRMTESLRASNRDLDQFAGIASHDLLSPLNTLSGYLNLLKENLSASAAPSLANFLTPCMGAIDRMHALICDLLTYSRIGTQRKPAGPVDCGKIVQATLANLRGAVSALDAQVTVEKLPTVIAVPSQIVQVFQNLVSNALNNHGSKPLRIRISSRRGKREWIFSVRDNGIGVSAADLERIFAPMERPRAGGNRHGTGLGLAIVKKIVESHGGRVWVESAEGRGASFRFTIPDRKAGDAVAEPPAGNGAGAAHGGSDEGR